jgi:D-glycero-D-manno-heptose 1,7-bisphosphate phosphatase
VSRVRAAFIDRDGVVNELVSDPDSGLPESPLEPGAVRLIPGAAAGLRRLAAAGWLLVGVSNQPAAAKGKATLAQVHSVQARVLELLGREGARFDDFKLCLHHPDAVVPDLRRQCDCRKPAPGMLLDAARQHRIDLRESWIIGDTDSDILAGQSAGCRTLLVEQPGSAHKRRHPEEADARVLSLDAAAQLLLEKEAVN